MQVLPASGQEDLDHLAPRMLSSHLLVASALPGPANTLHRREKQGPHGSKRALPCECADWVQTRTQLLCGDCFIFPAKTTFAYVCAHLCVCVCVSAHHTHVDNRVTKKSISQLLCVFIIGGRHLKECHWVHIPTCSLPAFYLLCLPFWYPQHGACEKLSPKLSPARMPVPGTGDLSWSGPSSTKPYHAS